VTPISPRRKLQSVGVALALTGVALAGVWLLTWPGPKPDAASGSALLQASAETGLTDLSQWQVQALRSKGALLATAALGLIATGVLGLGTMFFRGLFYLPSLLAGVAMFLLWKTLYRPEGGLINAGLRPVLASLQAFVSGTPAALWYAMGLLLALGTLVMCGRMLVVGVQALVHKDSGIASLMGRLGIIATFAACGLGLSLVLVQLPARSLLSSGHAPLTRDQLLAAATMTATLVPAADERELALAATTLGEPASVADAVAALEQAAGPGAAQLVRRAVLAQTSAVHEGLISGEGLKAPQWLIDSRWAKIALIFMGFWAGLGGGTMLLYLAGLSNIPPELYEAASIDGASGWQRFIHVTWPQLAPTTFFIVIMSTIGGLQGGFEQALVMTQGKADTIVLAYYIYNIAFTDQFQLGLASAIAWIMFVMIFAMTALNFRLGSQLTND
jgi:multiple sugar transport system permease protein